MVWCSMMQRCNNPNNKGYVNYGARGVTVCERWRKFDNFYADMGDPPKGLSLERKNNDNGYSKSNCIWADRSTQNRNRRSVVLTPMLIRLIKKYYESGIGTLAISEKLNLNKSTVGNVIYKNTWNTVK